MMQIFDELPSGIQNAPHDARMIAAGYQVAIREVNFAGVHDKDSLMQAFFSDLELTQDFGRNWDALFDVLTDPTRLSGKVALLLTDYAHFKTKRPKLAAELEQVLLDAQAEAGQLGRRLWLLSEELDTDTRHW